MCRSGNEGASVCARRCNGGLSPEERRNKLRAEYAANKNGIKDRRKARYEAAKELQQEHLSAAIGMKAPLPADATQAEKPNPFGVFFTEEELKSQDVHNLDNMSTAQDFTQLRKLAASSLSNLSTSAIVDDDLEFLDNNGSLNTVRRLTTEDGRVGYFKAYQDMTDDTERLEAYQYEEISPISSISSEVLAYHFAQKMGGEWAKLVPETVVREYKGMIGSFQEEVVGMRPGQFKRENGMPLNAPLVDMFEEEHFQRVAAFELLTAAVDRHAGNLLLNTDEDGKSRINLIDNGFNFSKNNRGGQSPFNLITHSYDKEPGTLNPAVRKELEALRDSPDLNGMSEMFTSDQVTSLKSRLNVLLGNNDGQPTLKPLLDIVLDSAASETKH